LPNYDVILIDGPPRLTTASIQALCASTHVLIPTILDTLSADAVGYFGQQLLAHEGLWPHLKVMGVARTMTNFRRHGAQEATLTHVRLQGDDEAALNTSGDRLRNALANGGTRLKYIMTKSAIFEFPYACSTSERADLARAAGEEIAYVARAKKIRDEAHEVSD